MRSPGISSGLNVPPLGANEVLETPSVSGSVLVDTLESTGTKPTTNGSSKSKSSSPSLLSRIIGTGGRKALLTGAVAAAMLGASFGYLSSTDPQPHVGAQIVAVADAPRGDEVARLSEGLTKVTALLAPLGLSQADAKASLLSVSASVELPAGHRRVLDSDVSIEAQPGARLYARVDEHGITLSMRPGLERIVDWGFDSKIEQITYRFADGTFRAHAEGFGPDSWHAEGVQEAIALRFGPMIPEAMRAPGYSPRNDPNLEANFQSIFDILRPSGSGNASATSFAAPTLSLAFEVPKTLDIALSDGEYSVHVDKGTRVDVSLSLGGDVNEPKLSSLDVRISPDPIEISKGAERASMRRLDLRGLTIKPGGEITADYHIGAEVVVDGLKLLLVLTATAADPRALNGLNIEPTRLESARREISSTIDEKIEPALRSLIRSLDLQAGGLSLGEIFSIPAEPTEVGPRDPS
jgi:hypothetical protein